MQQRQISWNDSRVALTIAFLTMVGGPLGCAKATSSGGGAASSTDATLSALTVSAGTLSPTFATATTAYTNFVPTTTSITVTPTVNQANATVTVSGTTTASGTASSAIALASGLNTINVIVTAQDASTTKTYALSTYSNHAIVSTLAGSTTSGSTNGTGTAASFFQPSGVAVDSSGSFYVADYGNSLIRKITSAGVVTTFAGNSSGSGYVDGTGTAASFYNPSGIAVDSSGNLYVGDSSNNVIRKITSAGVVSTLAGNTAGTSGSTNGSGTAATFSTPAGVAIDSSGNVYVADSGNHMIRKITSVGVVTTLAGNTTSGSTNGTGTSASFKSPNGIAVDSSGNVYVADTQNDMIRKITSAGVVTTLAGSTTLGSTNGTGTSAYFSLPYGVTVDGSGNVYVADSQNNMIRLISSGGVVSTLAGNTTSGSTSGTGTAASFNYPSGVTVDSSGYVYVGDTYNHSIRAIK